MDGESFYSVSLFAVAFKNAEPFLLLVLLALDFKATILSSIIHIISGIIFSPP